MDIDIVYLWCDDADAKWREKRLQTAARYGIATTGEVNGDCRYRSNDDLRYSLRSLELYAPWIRKVFLVIDDDATPPDWLKLNHSKLRIVRHSEILSQDCLPCFCSDNIEHSIANIEGLAEHFLLANDDCLFARKVSPGFFFGKAGYPIIRLCGKFHPPEAHYKDNYTFNLQRTMNLFASHHLSIQSAARKAMNRLPHHNIDAYCKSDVLAIRQEYDKEIVSQLRYPFRQETNVQRVIYNYEALQRKHGHLRLSSFNTSPFGSTLRKLIPAWADSLFFVNSLWQASPAMIKRFNPGLICYNDTDTTTDESRVWLRNQYARMYPNSSSYEVSSC